MLQIIILMVMIMVTMMLMVFMRYSSDILTPLNLHRDWDTTVCGDCSHGESSDAAARSHIWVTLSHMNARIHTHTYAHINAHIHTHTHKHTQTQTHMRAFSGVR
jgi:hypothetical protein